MKRISTLLFIISTLLSGISADTYTISDLDILDVWTYNYNASHWIEQADLKEGKYMYGEEFIPITEVPATIHGADFIQTAYGSKNFTGDTIAFFTLRQNADVYIIHSGEITYKPEWMNAYTFINETLRSTQGNFGLYKKHTGKAKQ